MNASFEPLPSHAGAHSGSRHSPSRTAERRSTSKLYAATGLNADRHRDFEVIGIAWQTRWGGGYWRNAEPCRQFSF
jgi:hypothetical protein